MLAHLTFTTTTTRQVLVLPHYPEMVAEATLCVGCMEADFMPLDSLPSLYYTFAWSPCVGRGMPKKGRQIVVPKRVDCSRA